MSPGISALFVRSLREEHRKPVTYVVRFVVITLILLLLTITQREYRYGGGAPGLAVFQSVTVLNLLFIALIGLGYFASAITEEKEDGTLGLLRMTNMSPLSILLGKSTSRLIAFLILLVTQLPFISLAVALGGVSLKQIFSCYFVLGAFTFLLGNLSLLFSVIYRRTSTAVISTVFVLLFLIFGVPILAAFFDELLGSDLGFATFGSWLKAISPTTGLMQVFELQFTEGVFWQPISNIIIGVVLFLISWAIFDLFNQGEGRGATPGATRWRSIVSTTPKPPGGKPRPSTDYAVTWREFYFQCGGVTRLWVSTLCILLIVGIIIMIGSVIGGSFYLDALGGVLLTVGLIIAGFKWAAELGTVFKHERLLQTWSALTLTPKSIRRIAYEKLIASTVATLPGLIIAAVGLFVIADEIELRYFFQEESIFAMVHALAWFCFASHLIVYLSLWLRWGAIPIALVSCFIIQIVVALFTALAGSSGSFEGYVVFWSLVLFASSAALHHLIGSRLISLAQQE